ncbi:MAG: hypothetical protein WCG47_11660 [Dermatophilaceae bacterium]
MTELPVDVSDHASVRALADAAAELGPVTQLVHTAGLSPVQASVEAILRVDLAGVAYALEEFGRVIAPEARASSSPAWLGRWRWGGSLRSWRPPWH